MPAGRPVSFDDEKQRRFCGLLVMGCTRAVAARAVGVSPRTVRRALIENAAFRERFTEAEANARMRALKAIFNAGSKSWRSQAWLVDYLDRVQRRGRGKRTDENSPASWDEVLSKVEAESELEVERRAEGCLGQEPVPQRQEGPEAATPPPQVVAESSVPVSGSTDDLQTSVKETCHGQETVTPHESDADPDADGMQLLDQDDFSDPADDFNGELDEDFAAED